MACVTNNSVNAYGCLTKYESLALENLSVLTSFLKCLYIQQLNKNCGSSAADQFITEFNRNDMAKA